jgi:F-type H+-transporting ATPase subunit b
MLASSGNFLIPNATFFAELIIFLIVFGVMAKWVLPPLQKAMADRAAGIRSEIHAAEAARAEAEHFSAERRQVLADARLAARGIVDEAARAAEEVREQARQRGQAERDRRLNEARSVIALERARARSEVSSQLGALVVAAAEAVIGSSVDPERHRSVINEAIAAAEAGD